MVHAKRTRKKVPPSPSWETFESPSEFKTANSTVPLDWSPFEQFHEDSENDFVPRRECTTDLSELASPVSSETGTLIPPWQSDEDPFRIREIFDGQQVFSPQDGTATMFQQDYQFEAHFVDGNQFTSYPLSSQSDPYNDGEDQLPQISTGDVPPGQDGSNYQYTSDQSFELAMSDPDCGDLDPKFNNSLLDTESESEAESEIDSKDDGAWRDLLYNIEEQPQSPHQTSPDPPKDAQLLQAHFMPSPRKRSRRKKVVMIDDDPKVRFFERSDEERQNLFKRKNKKGAFSKTVGYSDVGSYWEKKMRHFESSIESLTKSVKQVAGSFEVADGLQLCTSHPSESFELSGTNQMNLRQNPMGQSVKKPEHEPPKNADTAALKNLEELRKQFSKCASLVEDPPMPPPASNSGSLQEETPTATPTAMQDKNIEESYKLVTTKSSKRVVSTVRRKQYKEHIVVTPKSVLSPKTTVDTSRYLERKRSVVSATKRWLVKQQTPSPSCKLSKTVEVTSSLVQSLPHPTLKDDVTLPKRFGHKLEQPVLDDSSPFAFPPLAMRISAENSPDVSLDEQLREKADSPTSVADLFEVRHPTKGKQVAAPPSTYETVVRKRN